MTGEVTLIDKIAATEIKNPKKPCAASVPVPLRSCFILLHSAYDIRNSMLGCGPSQERLLTVIAAPHANELRSAPLNSAMVPLASPAITTIGAKKAVDRMLL